MSRRSHDRDSSSEDEPFDGIFSKIYGNGEKKACHEDNPTPTSAACPPVQKKPECPPPANPCAPKPPEKKPQQQSGGCQPKKSSGCPPKKSSEAKCRRSSRKCGSKKAKSRNPFIIFFLEMWFKKPCGRVAQMAKEAGKKWQCMPDKDKECYRKLAKIEQMKQRRKKCGSKRHRSKKSRRHASKCRKARRPKRRARC